MSRTRSNSSRSSYSSSDRSSSDREDGEQGDSTHRKSRRSMTDRSYPSKSSSPGQSPEGRTRVIMTHREPVSYSTSSKALRWQRLEPRFEPRYDYYRNRAMVDGARRDAAYYYAHRRKIIEAKPVVDNRPPQIFSHVYCNMKKLHINQERQNFIENQNRRLLGKLATAMTTSRVDNWNTNASPKSSSPGRRFNRYPRDSSQNEAEYRKWQDRRPVRESSDFDSESGDRSPPRHKDQQKARSRERDGERHRDPETRIKYA